MSHARHNEDYRERRNEPTHERSLADLASQRDGEHPDPRHARYSREKRRREFDEVDREPKRARSDTELQTISSNNAITGNPAKQPDVDDELLKLDVISVKKPEPVPLEDLLKNQNHDTSAKPKFLTREERERLALERREAAVREQRRKQEEAARAREAYLASLRNQPDRTSADSRQQTMRDWDRDKVPLDAPRDSRGRGRDYHDRDYRGGDRREDYRSRDHAREGGREYGRPRESQHSREANSDMPLSPEELERQQREKELAEIKAHYLGTQKPKKRTHKAADKYKFVFQWDPSEDTAGDGDPFFAGITQRQRSRGHDYDNERRAYRHREIEDGEYEPMSQVSTTHRPDYARVPERTDRPEKVRNGRSDSGGLELPGRHWSEKSLSEMNERDWRIFKEDFNIVMRGGNLPHPLRSWSESSLPKPLLDAIAAAGYREPTPIQRAAIPIALTGRDVLGTAETGSGKTAAFVLPMLVYISKQPKLTPETEGDGPYAVIMVPTRELAQQIERETERFGAPLGIRTVSLVGGQSIEEQAFLLRKGCEVVIATPGRLKDCLDRRFIVLNQCNYLVLDEADRMVEMGFHDQLNAVLDAMPLAQWKSADEHEAAMQEGSGNHRITMMFSATMPPAVERLARKYLRRPAYVTIGEVGKAAETVEQRVVWVAGGEREKLRRLFELLNTTNVEPPIMIFVNKKKSADVLVRTIEREGFSAVALHSSRSQEQRELALEGFREGRYDILVATDVAARGLDIKGVTHVINFDMPKDIDSYTHRIGRTGRAGKRGIAISYLMPEDAHIMYDLKQLLQRTNNPIPPDLAKHPAAQFKPAQPASAAAATTAAAPAGSRS